MNFDKKIMLVIVKFKKEFIIFIFYSKFEIYVYE